MSSFFPHAPGVVVFLSEHNQCVLVSMASDLRAFIGSRLGIDADPDRPSPKANLMPVTRTIRAFRTGVGLETQWVLTQLARTHSPELCRDLKERASVSFLCFEDEPMRWSVVDAAQLCAQSPSIQRASIGPIARPIDATSIANALDDAFSLCRYPKELSAAPQGTACAYKDMGKCPGACDGSETLDSYRSRYQNAQYLIRTGVAPAIEECNASITQASSAMDFESAAAHKAVLDALKSITLDRVRWARRAEGMKFLVLTPSVRRGWAGVWVFGQDGLTMLGAVEEHASHETIEGILGCAHKQEGLSEMDERGAVDLGLVSRVMHAKPGRGRKRVACVFDLRNPPTHGQLHKAIMHAANPAQEESPDAEP